MKKLILILILVLFTILNGCSNSTSSSSSSSSNSSSRPPQIKSSEVQNVRFHLYVQSMTTNVYNPQVINELIRCYNESEIDNSQKSQSDPDSALVFRVELKNGEEYVFISLGGSRVRVLFPNSKQIIVRGPLGEFIEGFNTRDF